MKRALLAAWLVVIALVADARGLWLIEDGRLTRIDFGAASVQTVPMRDYVRDVAPIGDEGAWILTDDALVRLDLALVERARVALDPVVAAAAGAMTASPVDGSVSIGAGNLVMHVDGSGAPAWQAVLEGPVLAIAAAGPDAIFAATASTLVRLDAAGAVRSRADVSHLPGDGATGLLPDPLAGLVWLVRTGALLQFDALAGLVLRASRLVAGPDATAIEPHSGIVTLASGREIARIDREAAPVLPSAFTSEALFALAGVDVERLDAMVWFGDGGGLGTIDLTNGAVLRFSGQSAVGRFAADPLHFEPRLEIDSPQAAAGGTATALTLRFRTYCDGFVCTPSPAYMRGVRLWAQRAERDVTELFVPNANRDAFHGSLPGAPWEPASPLRAWVIDAFGHRSKDTVVEWPLSTSGAKTPYELKSAPTVSITAPVNNASFTAPLSTTIKASAAAGTGASVSKVDFYVGATLVGTATTSPYNFNWPNVQVGAYALTAKVTDTLNATTTSPTVNVTVTAGATAKPLDAYLFNDPWASSLVVSDAAGTHNGTPTGTVSAIASAANAPKPDTCKAANFAGGAVDVAGLTVSTAAAAKTTVAFWMYWNGTDGVMPLGWVTHGLVLSGGSLGFTTQNGDVFGIASTGFANKWHHVVAEFTNGAVASDKLYVDGVAQTLTQRAGVPNNAYALVAASMRIGGLSGNSGLRFLGQLDEVKVFNRALTPTEVSAEFAAANPCSAAPSVTLTAPADNASYVAPSNVAMSATASANAAGATLTKVEFYNGATVLSVATGTPFAYTWANPAVGNYVLTAKATDSKGATATSTAATIHVKANVAPAVSITAPANNASYTAPATINLAASATDSDGAVAKVEFYQGTTKLATLTAAPYTYAWNSVAGGNYALTAKATDDKGAVTTSATVNVKVNKPPTVSITSPANNSSVVLPATVTINASASDSDGSIAKVEFYRDGVLLGSDTASPYSYAWTVPGSGTYVLTAKATDNLGAVTTSAAVTVIAAPNQLPSVSITSPAAGARFFVGAAVTIAATAGDPDGSIAKVEFYADTGSGPVRLATDTTSPYGISQPLAEGTNVLTAVATDNKGATTTSAPVTVTVTQDQAPIVVLSAPADGQRFVAPAAPPDITLAATASDSDGHVVAVRFYKQKFGTNEDPAPVLLGTVTTAPYQMTWHSVPYNDPPTSASVTDSYMLWAEATDDFGALATSDFVGILVLAAPPPNFEMLEISRPASPGGAAGIVFAAPATIVFEARQKDSGPNPYCAAAQVDFLANAAPIGTITANDIANAGGCFLVWRNVAAGTYKVTASLLDDSGSRSAPSDPVTVTVQDRAKFVSVALQSPAKESVIPLTAGVGPTPIPLAAAVNDPTGTVIGVEYYDSYEYVTSASAVPYAASESPSRWGLHVIRAVTTGGTKVSSPPVYASVPLGPRPPVVMMTSPVPTRSYDNHTAITISANAMPTDGAVAKVEFYDGPYLIGTDTTSPFSITAYVSGGTHALYAIAYAPFASGVSAPVTIDVAGTGAGAQISLTSPSNDQHFFGGAGVPLSVNLTDPNHIITKVEYWTTGANGKLLGTATQAPWSAPSWVPDSLGDYTVTAVGTYAGGRITSPQATIHIDPNQPPTISITSPIAGQQLYVGQLVPIVASVADPDGTVAKVEFLVNGALIGSATASPFAFNWVPSATGTYQLSAKATDAVGASATTTPFSVTVNANVAPTVGLMQPQAGQSFWSGGTINLGATASDSDGSIARVEFYAGATLLGASTSAPYAFAWTNVAAGLYSLTARAVDDHGAVTTSSAVSVTVQPLALNVTAPADGASVASDFVLVKGTLQAPPNSGVSVDGAVAASDGTNFFVGNIPLSPGANVITIALTTAEGQSVTQTRTVTSTATSPYQITADVDASFAPATVVLSASRRLERKIVGASLSGLGGATADPSAFDGQTIAKLTFSTPGRYDPVVTLTDDSGATYTQSVAILVLDEASLGALVKSVWTGFVAALTAGDKAAALRRVSSAMHFKYGPVLDVLAPHLPQIVATWSVPVTGALADDLGELVVGRTWQGKDRAFFIYVMREKDGVWRIMGM
ncbi:MAG TPA: Ig-like domain-containing protein [Casimicrobiaceae bacterium]|nr:Ig-like domain-containing protein [Casimicrobiaceae bacterium]